jgi:hypothetical protein
MEKQHQPLPDQIIEWKHAFFTRTSQELPITVMDVHHEVKNQREAGVFEVHALVLLGAMCGLWTTSDKVCARAAHYAEHGLRRIKYGMRSKLVLALMGFVSVGPAPAVDAGAAVPDIQRRTSAFSGFLNIMGFVTDVALLAATADAGATVPGIRVIPGFSGILNIKPSVTQFVWHRFRSLEKQ